MSGELKIIDLSECDAMEYCRNEGWQLPEKYKSGVDLNAYWAFVGQKIIGIMYGREEKLRVLLLGFVSDLPKEIFYDIVRKKIYTWKQMGVIVESRIEGWSLGRNDMVLPCPLDRVLKSMR